MPDEAKELAELRQLRDIVKGFVDKQQIICAESVYQCDRVIENAYEFIENCCDVVGYYKDPDDEKEPEPECECKGHAPHDPHCPLSDESKKESIK